MSVLWLARPQHSRTSSAGAGRYAVYDPVQACKLIVNRHGTLMVNPSVDLSHSWLHYARPHTTSNILFLFHHRGSVSICDHSRARLVDSSRNRTFWRGYANLMRSYGWLLEPRGSNLTPLKSKRQFSCVARTSQSKWTGSSLHFVRSVRFFGQIISQKLQQIWISIFAYR